MSNLIGNFINLNIQKLFLRGNITKAYQKMYGIAEEIASHEMQRRIHYFHKMAKKKTKDNIKDYVWEYGEEMVKYKEKRTQHHLNEMKELLKMREQIEVEKK
jgi:allophanate hydrolase subunit 1